MYAYIDRMLAHTCKKIICISESERKSALEKRICNANKMQVILNGIDVDEILENQFTVTKGEMGIPSDAYIIGIVGRLSEQKAPDIVIQAARVVAEKIPNAFFLFVGSGEMEEKVRIYAKHNNLEGHVMITGWVDNPEEYIQLFDIAMLVSRWEGFGLVLPEYMIARKPVIATSVDAIPEIIQNEKNGLLIEPNSVDQLIAAICKLYSDEKLCCKLSKYGEDTVRKKYDVKRVSVEHERVFLKLLDK